MQRPMLAVVLCRSQIKSTAFSLPFGPSRPFTSWARVTSYGVVAVLGALQASELIRRSRSISNTGAGRLKVVRGCRDSQRKGSRFETHFSILLLILYTVHVHCSGYSWFGRTTYTRLHNAVYEIALQLLWGRECCAPEQGVGEAAVHVHLRVSPAHVHGPGVRQHRRQGERVEHVLLAHLQLLQEVHPTQLISMGAAADCHP